MSEAETQAAILRRYQGHPTICLWRQNTGAVKIGGRFVRFGLTGCADLVGMISPSGRALYVEVKSATGKQRPAQLAFQRLVAKYGGLYVLARSVDDVVNALESEG